MQIAGTVLAVLFSFSAIRASGQAAEPLPEAPVAQNAAPQGAAQVKAPEPIDGDSLYAPIAIGNQPQSLKCKTSSYVVAAFGPKAIVAPAFSAAFKMALPPKGYPPEWRQGAAAFGRNYGAALGSKVAQETGRYATGALLHEDFRYRPSEKQGSARLFYALGYTFVDSTDSGRRTPAVANFAGAAAGGFIGNLYLPDGFNSRGDGARSFATKFAGLAAKNVLREFSPEISKTAHALHLPFPTVPAREWWKKKPDAVQP